MKNEKDPTFPTHADQPADTPKSDPKTLSSSVSPGNTVSVINSAILVGQTTWQKLSNRINALERNEAD